MHGKSRLPSAPVRSPTNSAHSHTMKTQPGTGTSRLPAVYSAPPASPHPQHPTSQLKPPTRTHKLTWNRYFSSSSASFSSSSLASSRFFRYSCREMSLHQQKKTHEAQYVLKTADECLLALFQVLLPRDVTVAMRIGSRAASYATAEAEAPQQQRQLKCSVRRNNWPNVCIHLQSSSPHCPLS